MRLAAVLAPIKQLMYETPLAQMTFTSFFVVLEMHYLESPSFISSVHICFGEGGRGTKCRFGFGVLTKIKMTRVWH